MADTPTSISDLQAKWFSLSDLDQARAVEAIHRSGTSIRAIAKGLKRSESSIRRLLIALQAPAEDRLLAKQGKISTNELVRRARAAGLEQDAKAHEAQELKRAKAAAAGSRRICKWLEDEELQKGFSERVILEARRILAKAEQTKKFPKYPAPPDTPITEIIRLCSPSKAVVEKLSSAACYGAWLARWVWYAFPDGWVRDQALDLALDEQPKRPNLWRRNPMALDPNDMRLR